jgi:hypothetical protein
LSRTNKIKPGLASVRHPKDGNQDGIIKSGILDAIGVEEKKRSAFVDHQNKKVL